MSWGTPASAVTLSPSKREDGSFDWSNVVQSDTYKAETFFSDTSNPLHAAWLAERDRALKEWDSAKDLLARAKESEAEARKYVQAFAFGGGAKEGMNNQPLANGYVLKFGNKLNYNLNTSVEAIDKAEDAAIELGERGKFLFERVITYKPEFSKSEYNKLDESDPTDKAVKALIDGLLTITQATGSLEIKEPKAKLNG